MSTTFPKSRKRGYNVEQVEDFLEKARRAYAASASENITVSSESIRRTAFTMQGGGYSVSHVDAAMERLEDAFAARERERALQLAGESTWLQESRSIAQEIVDRLARPAGHRFDRAAFLVNGYRRREVDELCDRISVFLQTGSPLNLDEVRAAAFHPQKGGYREAQVDMLLDSAIDVMLAVR